MFIFCVFLRFFQQHLSTFLNLKSNYTNSFKKSFYSIPSSVNNKLSTVQNYNSTNNLFNRVTTPVSNDSLINYSTSIHNNVLYYLVTNYTSYSNFNTNLFYSLIKSLKVTLINLLNIFKRTIGDGFLYLRGLFIICFIDACLTDDEPI